MSGGIPESPRAGSISRGLLGERASVRTHLEISGGLAEFPQLDEDDERHPWPGQAKNALNRASRPREGAVPTDEPETTGSGSPSRHGAEWIQTGQCRTPEPPGAQRGGAELTVPLAHERPASRWLVPPAGEFTRESPRAAG